MHEYLQKRPKLLIVSDTAVIVNDKGEVAAFEPVVREIEHFYPLFDSITWIAARYPVGDRSHNVREIKEGNINYILYDRIGGAGLVNRLKIIAAYFKLFVLILTNVKKADVIHSRGPAHAAILCAILSFFIRKNKIYWHKYAGNWAQHNPPYSYRFLRYILRRADHTVITINGRWEGQKANQLTFENPCLTQGEREEGLQAIERKNYSGKLDFVFIGRLEDAKGVQRILNVFSKISNERIGKIHFVGDGEKRADYERFAKAHCKHEVIFHGFLSRTDINTLLDTAHVFLLPSDSEGFPKVIAESANYGLIPIVSDVSSIGQYIKEGQTGYLIPGAAEEILKTKIEQFLTLEADVMKTIAENCCAMAEKFTYAHYNKRIKEEIIGWR